MAIAAKGFMLLLLGIPVIVWLKWRQKKEPAPVAWVDADAALLRSTDSVPPTAPPEHERIPIGLGVD